MLFWVFGLHPEKLLSIYVFTVFKVFGFEIWVVIVFFVCSVQKRYLYMGNKNSTISGFIIVGIVTLG